MKICIRLFGVFRIDRFKEEILEYPAESRVLDIIEDLKISRTLLGFVLINDVHAEVEDHLNNGDTLMVLPLLGGG